MRFDFELPQPIKDEHVQKEQKSLTPSSSSTPKNDDVQWPPLQNHPLFSDAGKSSPASVSSPRNLMVWDGACRIFFWDSHNNCLHRISIRLGEPEPTSVLAASPSKVLQADIELDFVVTRISVNRNGSALLLSGSHGICVMYLYGRTSATNNSIMCRTAPVGSEVYQNSSDAIRVLQVIWHPYSDTHLAADSVFRCHSLSIPSVSLYSAFISCSKDPSIVLPSVSNENDIDI